MIASMTSATTATTAACQGRPSSTIDSKGTELSSGVVEKVPEDQAEQLRLLQIHGVADPGEALQTGIRQALGHQGHVLRGDLLVLLAVKDQVLLGHLRHTPGQIS